MTTKCHIDPLYRILSILSGMFVMISLGSAYAISAWNSELKQTLHFNQSDISFISSMASFGAYFSVPPGYIYDKIGPHWSILVASILLSVMYFIVYFIVSNDSSTISSWSIAICFGCIGQSSDFGIFSSLGANEGLFGASHRGKIMGLLLSSYSAGGALFAFIYHEFYDNNVIGYFKLMAIELLIICLISYILFYRNKHNIYTQETIPINNNKIIPPTNDDIDSILIEIEDITGIQLLKDSRFWLLFIPVLICVGAALFIMANMAFIIESINGSKQMIPNMVALFSISNCLGRILTGLLSDYFIHSYPRPFFAGISSILTGFSHFIFLILPNASFICIPIAISGFAEGIMFSIFPVITREMFGVKHFGKNYGYISLANAIGYPLILGPLSSLFYHLYSKKNSEQIEKCYGTKCFQNIYIIVMIISLVSLYCCILLVRRQNYKIIK